MSRPLWQSSQAEWSEREPLTRPPCRDWLRGRQRQRWRRQEEEEKGHTMMMMRRNETGRDRDRKGEGLRGERALPRKWLSDVKLVKLHSPLRKRDCLCV